MLKISVKRIFPAIFRAIVFVALSLAPPLTWFFVTDAGGPVWLPILCSICVVPWAAFVNQSSFLPRVVARVVSALAVAAAAAVAFVFLINAIIIPFPAYVAWFDRLAAGRPSGSVAYVFVLAAAILSTATAVLVVRALTFATRAGFHRTLGAFLGWAAAVIIPMSIALGDPRLTVAWILVAASSVLLASGRAAVGFLALALPAVGIPAVAIRDSLPPGSALVDDRAAPFFRRLVVDLIPNYPLVFSIPGYGFGHSSNRLGGRPVLSGGPVFTVEASFPGTYYLRSAVFTRYHGDAWSVAPRTGGAEGEEEERELESVMSYVNEHGILSSPPELRVTIRTELYEAVPHTLDTVAFRKNGGPWQIVTPSMRATGIAAEPPLSVGDTIELQTVPPSLFVPHGEEASTLDLASEIPEVVRAAAREAAGGGLAPTVNGVLDLIRRDTNYSLDVPDLPQGGDIVHQLLWDTEAGYCVHYASAFCVLSALNEIPVRYVTGILAVASDEYFQTEITGFSSHAWPEVFDPAGYWRVVEATPPMQADGGAFRVAGDRYTQEQLAAALARPQVDGGEAESIAAVPEWLPAVITGVIVLVGVGVPGFVFVRRRSRGIKSLGRRLVRIGQKDAVPNPEVTGWTHWQAHAAVRYAAIAGHVRRSGRILQEYAFARRRPRKIDRRYLVLTATKMRRARKQPVSRS